MQTIKQLLVSHKKWVIVSALVVIIIIGASIRLWGFPNTPAGLNQDEIAAAYEAYSLVETGGDRWGNHLPAYFPAWGSGQNVLYSYLTAPFVALFGLTPFSVRAVAVIFGILAIPLLFLAVRRWYGTKAALLAAFVLAVTPWHFMLSRWGLESNLLPFFLLLGVYTFGKAIDKKSTNITRYIALAPFALALYAYGIGSVVIAGILVLLFVCYFKQIKQHILSWVIAAGLFVVLALPFGLFMLKNYILRSSLWFEDLLPFSIPMLSQTRLEQIAGDTLGGNVSFIVSGFNDQLPWNSLPNAPVIFGGIVILAFFAIVWRIVFHIKRRDITLSPFLVWFIASVPLFFIAPLNLNQSNAIYIPIIVMAVDGVMIIARSLRQQRAMYWTLIGIFILYVSLAGFLAVKDYFSNNYQSSLNENFNPGFSSMLIKADALAGDQPLYITNTLLLNYVQTLWYLHISPQHFQSYKPTFTNANFDKYYFYPGSVGEGRQFFFIIREGDEPVCDEPRVLERNTDWLIGRCPPLK
jgi:4-amino-4-deoxy-L-arabinose transferase-like glycosyltransferase